MPNNNPTGINQFTKSGNKSSAGINKRLGALSAQVKKAPANKKAALVKEMAALRRLMVKK